jgi:CubicO group peptidase (beta-lactamase class C family)
MKLTSNVVRALVWLAMLITAHHALGAPARHEDLQVVAPEAVGFSGERLKNLDALLRHSIDDKQYAGVVALLARHGKVVYFEAIGKSDLASGAPMEKDTIFRLGSMSKPVTAAAMMLLYEEGKWQPHAPIARYVPEFSHLKVSKTFAAEGIAGGDAERTEDPVHAPTMRELMTHTAGFEFIPGGLETFQANSLQSMIDRIAQIPLLYQPSSRWVYGVSMDIQGYIIEKLSGTTLPEFMRKRLFEPLGMTDTGFYVSKEKWSRFASLYGMNDQGELVAASTAAYHLNYDHEPELPLAGGGLVATAPDYFRFAQMLLDGGKLNGTRVLGPSSVKLMMSNQLPDRLMEGYQGADFNCPRLGMGYGYNGAVITNPGKADVPMGRGTYLWDGAFGTWFWVDPVYEIVFVGMIQSNGYWPNDTRALNLEETSRGLTYQALVRPDR